MIAAVPRLRSTLNGKVILINGISRSGSNILWNIMQSHPRVCSPISETNRLLHPGVRGFNRLSRFLYTKAPVSLVGGYIDRKLYRAKIATADHASNKYRTEDELYSPEELRDAVLCLKALNDDIYLTDLFYSMYDDIQCVGLVRNGYAVCEGRVRRGETADEVGRSYMRYMSKIVEDSQRLANYTIVRFEDMVRDPFEVAESLYRFCGLVPERAEKLRLKSKRIMTQGGTHSHVYGNAGDKYWFDRNTIASFMDPDVDSAQSGALTDRDRRVFERHAGPILEYFSYS